MFRFKTDYFVREFTFNALRVFVRVFMRVFMRAGLNYPYFRLLREPPEHQRRHQHLQVLAQQHAPVRDPTLICRRLRGCLRTFLHTNWNVNTRMYRRQFPCLLLERAHRPAQEFQASTRL